MYSLISLFLAIYIAYMFQFFKTTVSINHPFEYLILNKINYNILNHNTDNQYNSKICQFGKVAILALIAFLLYRTFKKIPKNINLLVFLVTLIMSFLNFNAFLYLIPYYAIEIYYYL